MLPLYSPPFDANPNQLCVFLFYYLKNESCQIWARCTLGYFEILRAFSIAEWGVLKEALKNEPAQYFMIENALLYLLLATELPVTLLSRHQLQSSSNVHFPPQRHQPLQHLVLYASCQRDRQHNGWALEMAVLLLIVSVRVKSEWPLSRHDGWVVRRQVFVPYLNEQASEPNGSSH